MRPAVGLGYLRAPSALHVPHQRGFPAPRCTEYHMELIERCPVLTFTAQTPWPFFLHSHI